MVIIQMELRIGQRNFIRIAHVKENQRIIQVTLDQIVLVDIRTVALEERNKIPL